MYAVPIVPDSSMPRYDQRRPGVVACDPGPSGAAVPVRIRVAASPDSSIERLFATTKLPVKQLPALGKSILPAPESIALWILAASSVIPSQVAPKLLSAATPDLSS